MVEGCPQENCCQDVEQEIVFVQHKLQQLPPSRALSLVQTHLDTARLWLKEYKQLQCQGAPDAQKAS